MSVEIKPNTVLEISAKFRVSEIGRRDMRHIKLKQVPSRNQPSYSYTRLVNELKIQDQYVRMLFINLHRIVRTQVALALSADIRMQQDRAAEKKRQSPPARNQSGWSNR